MQEGSAVVGKRRGSHPGGHWELKGQRTDLDISGNKYESSTPLPSYSLCYFGFLPVSHTSGTLLPHECSHSPDFSSPKLPWLTSLDPSSFCLNIPFLMSPILINLSKNPYPHQSHGSECSQEQYIQSQQPKYIQMPISNWKDKVYGYTLEYTRQPSELMISLQSYVKQG